MQNSSEEFANLLRQDHRVSCRVDITEGGSSAVVASSGKELELLEGTVRADRQSSSRRTASLRFGDSLGLAVPTKVSNITDTEWFDPLSYFEFRPYRGLYLSDGSKEMKPQGVLYIDRLEVEEDENGVFLSVELGDRSKIISENPWRQPYNIANGTNYATAIQNIILDRAEHFTPVFSFSETSETTPDMTFDIQEDPWDAAVKMAEGIGMELFFGIFGEVVLQPVPDPQTAPIVDTYNTATDGVRIAPLSRSMERSTARSGVIVRGSAPWITVPVEAEIWDDDPLSATYRYGPLGEKPEIIEDAIVTNAAQAGDAAQGEFNKVVGILEEITFNAIVDPRLESGDIIEINSDKAGVEGRFVLERFELPLEAERAMNGNTRRRRRQ